MPLDPRTLTPEQALRTGRVVWAALLAGPVILAGVVLGVPVTVAGEANAGSAVAWAALVATLVGVPLGHLLRARLWARGTKDHVVAPLAWLRGSVVLWALCEGAATLGLVAVLLDRPSPERLAAPLAAFVAQALAWPRAEPLGLGAR